MTRIASLNMSNTVLFIIAIFMHSSVFALDVVVTIKPIHSLVQSVLGNSAKAKLLLDNSASPHDVQLKPSDIKSLNQANVVFMIDRSFEGFMNTVINAAPTELNIIELGRDAALQRLPIRGHDHNTHDDEEHAFIDPHLWLNPQNAKTMVKIIASRLTNIDESNSKLYQENLNNTLRRLSLLDEDLAMKLDKFKTLAFITQHDAYQYFDERYDLNFIKSIALDSSIPPSVKLALNIQKSIKSDNVRCIFREPQFSDRLINVIAENTGIHSGILDPIGVDLTPGEDLYFDLMNNLGSNFTDCLADRP